jgi:hypothetical protein
MTEKSFDAAVLNYEQKIKQEVNKYLEATK